MIFKRERKQTELDAKALDRLGEVERQQRMLQLEWSDTLDRLKTMMHRAIKERQRAEEARGETEEPVPPPETTQLDPITQRILARRHRISGGTQ